MLLDGDRCLALPGKHMLRESGLLISVHGKSKARGKSYATQLTGNAILAWTELASVDWHYIAPSNPAQNALIEYFNGYTRTSF